MREVMWVGASQDDLRAFPSEARRAVGFALRRAQAGEKHPAAKPLKGFGGASVLEIVVDDADWERVGSAVAEYVAGQPQARLVLELKGKEHGSPQWWEGVQVLEWRAG